MPELRERLCTYVDGLTEESKKLVSYNNEP